MKTTIIKCISALFLVTTLSGCDFLEPKAVSEFVPRDAASLNEMLLGNAYPLKGKQRFNLFLNLMDDDVAAAPYQPAPIGLDVNRFIAPFSWQPNLYSLLNQSGYSTTDIYMPYYELILGCNAVIDYIGQVSDTQENIDLVLAQAHALRAFHYFKLVNIFAKPYNVDPAAPGVPLKKTSQIEQRLMARASVREVYDFILAELSEAERLYKGLSDAPYWKDDARTSLPMVYLLFSRTYLYMENWEKAAEYAKLVMDDDRFKLNDLNSIPEYDSNGVLYYNDFHSYTNSTETIWIYGNLDDYVGWAADNLSYSHAFFRASPELMNSFEDGDLRKSRYITRSRLRIDGEYMPHAFGKVNMSKSGSYYLTLTETFTFGRSFRLAEAYLNYAEAEAMLGGDGIGKSIKALNDLRRKRFTPATYTDASASDQNSLIKFVREERRRELCFEDFRWYDLRRWGMPEIKHVWYTGENTGVEYTLSQGDPQYTIPFPDVALEQNSALEQNPLGPAPRPSTSL